MTSFALPPDDPQLLRLRLYPDPVLRARAFEVTSFGPALEAAVRRMFDVMYEAEGIGLAAPQVGWSQRVFVVNLDADREHPGAERVFVNPVLEGLEGTSSAEEGCLSLPELRAEVRRATRLTVRALDEKGQPFSLVADELLARCIQHEHDHLDGILFVTRLSLAARLPLRRALKDLERRYQREREAGERTAPPMSRP